MSECFTWNGRELPTVGELLDAALAADSEGRAGEFISAYRSHTPHADHNLGYLIGYIEPAERRHHLYEAFGVGHPIFGGRS